MRPRLVSLLVGLLVVLALIPGSTPPSGSAQEAKGQRLVFASAGFDESNRFWVVSRPDHGVRFGKGGKVQPLGPQITIIQTRAEHSSEITVADPATKKSTTYPAGEPAGFIIQFENGFSCTTWATPACSATCA